MTVVTPPIPNVQRLGKVIGGRYVLTEKVLGSGHAGEVFEGWDIPTGSRIAIKALRKKYRFQIVKWAMFSKEHIKHNIALYREMMIGETLKDIEGVYKPFDAVDTPTRVYLIMHAAEGDLMQFVLDDRCAWGEPEYRALLGPAFETVLGMHSAGYAHRDIKLENMLLFHTTGQYDVMLTDLELAAPLSSAHARESVGTPEYCAPEVTQCPKVAVDYTLADAWSLGVTLYACLTGCFPFGKVTKTHGLRDRSVVVFPSGHNKHVSADAKDLIRGLLRFNPEERLTVREALEHPWFLKPIREPEYPSPSAHIATPVQS